MSGVRPLRRRKFCGGCSWVEYQRIGAWWHGPFLLVRTHPLGVCVLERWWSGRCRVVFGTLLGPEATGPGALVPWGLFVSGFPATNVSCAVGPFLWGLVCGVCGVGLLFENYIVDASIFHEEPLGFFMDKQFPRIGTWIWPHCLRLFRGLRGCGWFLWFSRVFLLLIFCGQVFKSTRWMPWH